MHNIKTTPYDEAKKPAAPSYSINGLDGSVTQDGIRYLSGFGGEFQSESLAGALPLDQNNPQAPPYGLIGELISGTSFTTPRYHNRRTWLYRIRPTAGHEPFRAVADADDELIRNAASPRIIGDFSKQIASPSQYRWKPFPLANAAERVDFVQGIATICGAGNAETKSGIAIHYYAANASMNDKAFANSDGDLLVVPQQGTLDVTTELGRLLVPRGHIVVIPRGILFSVALTGDVDAVGGVRGYILECFTGHFNLPELGPIGSNGLANPRDFLHPTAAYEDRRAHFTVVQKYAGECFTYVRPHSPFNVVAWRGNYAPFMYDLNRFVPAGAIRIDHLDPSIFTVLTCPTSDAGVAAVDFVIFPPRWAVAEHTFRPPWYHRNTMSEFMGNIYGRYEARPDGFLPGGASLHSCMAGHGPDGSTYEKASATSAELSTASPMRMTDDSMSFMFETSYLMRLTQWAIKAHPADPNYYKCWTDIPVRFDPTNVPAYVRAGQQQRHQQTDGLDERKEGE